jgi:ketosteroid isomerase-like protein
VSEENVAIIKAIFEADATTSKDEILQALPNLIPAPFHPDAEWAEAPDRVDAKPYRGHDGILESFEQRLDQSEDCKIEALRFEDHDDQVFVVGRESGRGHGSGASTDATVYSVVTFRDGKISQYREFYDEAAARAALERHDS